MTSIATRKLLILSGLKGVGPATLRKVLQLPSFETLDAEHLATLIPAVEKIASAPGAWDAALDSANRQVERAGEENARILSPADGAFPPLLAASRHNPILLYVRGALAPNPDDSVAIIGTREPTRHGTMIATRVSRFFCEREWSVVSGLAFGCDAAAHQGALDAGGHTVAVLAHGLHTVAPVAHRALAERILDGGGALVSQFPLGRDVRPQQFAQRDKVQAGLTRGVVMVQSDLEGGSLIASRAALADDRWLAVPAPTERDRASRSPKIRANQVLAEGARDEKLELLRVTTQTALSRLFVLNGRDDYARCLEPTPASAASGDPSGQASIF